MMVFCGVHKAKDYGLIKKHIRKLEPKTYPPSLTICWFPKNDGRSRQWF